MRTERKQSLALGISFMAAICLIAAALFVNGCGRQSSDSTEAAPAAPESDVVVGVVLRANPNPVPGGSETGKTTITWQTGSEAIADIFSVSGADEILFASGARGSKEASIRPGANEFRLYNQGQHKLVTSLVVTMPEPASSANP